MTNQIPRGECAAQEKIHTPHRRNWNFLGGGEFCKAKHLKKCMKLYWDFQRGGNLVDIFLNYTDNKYTCMFSTTFLDVSGQFKQIRIKQPEAVTHLKA